MDHPNKLNIEIEQNASYGLTLQLTEDDDTPTNITNWSFTGSIRETYDSPNAVAFFSMSAVTDAAIVSAFLTDEQTWGLSGSAYFYDIIAKNPNSTPNQTFRLLYGKVRINRGVTEP